MSGRTITLAIPLDAITPGRLPITYPPGCVVCGRKPARPLQPRRQLRITWTTEQLPAGGIHKAAWKEADTDLALPPPNYCNRHPGKPRALLDRLLRSLRLRDPNRSRLKGVALKATVEYGRVKGRSQPHLAPPRLFTDQPMLVVRARLRSAAAAERLRTFNHRGAATQQRIERFLQARTDLTKATRRTTTPDPATIQRIRAELGADDFEAVAHSVIDLVSALAERPHLGNTERGRLMLQASQLLGLLKGGASGGEH